MNRYILYSSAAHAAVLVAVLAWGLVPRTPPVYYGFQFLGGQSGFGTGKLEPAPAPLSSPAPAPKAPETSPDAPGLKPGETLSPSEQAERVALPVKPGAKKPPEGRNTKKGQGVKGGRGESSFGKGDFQGSKTGPVGGVGTSLEIGGFGPGSGGAADSQFPYKWYGELVYKRLWENWDRTDAGTRECKVAFVIHKDGRVSEVRVKTSSGDSFFDMTAKRAVSGAGPFPPLPDGFKEDRLPVMVRFRLQ